MTTHQLDARNLLCPMPVIKLQNKVKDMSVGDTLELLCTDPGTLEDIPSWCRIYGHEVLTVDDKEREIKFSIKVN